MNDNKPETIENHEAQQAGGEPWPFPVANPDTVASDRPIEEHLEAMRDKLQAMTDKHYNGKPGEGVRGALGQALADGAGASLTDEQLRHLRTIAYSVTEHRIKTRVTKEARINVGMETMVPTFYRSVSQAIAKEIEDTMIAGAKEDSLTGEVDIQCLLYTVPEPMARLLAEIVGALAGEPVPTFITTERQTTVTKAPDVVPGQKRDQAEAPRLIQTGSRSLS